MYVVSACYSMLKDSLMKLVRAALLIFTSFQMPTWSLGCFRTVETVWDLSCTLVPLLGILRYLMGLPGHCHVSLGLPLEPCTLYDFLGPRCGKTPLGCPETTLTLSQETIKGSQNNTLKQNCLWDHRFHRAYKTAVFTMSRQRARNLVKYRALHV